MNGSSEAGFLRLNAFECIHCSLSLSLFMSIFLLCLLFRFPLNDGFLAGFLRLNAFGFTAPDPFISIYLSFLLANSLPQTVSLSFPD
jgi:hypothetical protein